MISPFAVVLGLVLAFAIGLALLIVSVRPDRERSNLFAKKGAIFVVLVVAASAFAAQGMEGTLAHDEAVFVVTNTEVANGNLPYTAAFDNTGPLGPWIGGIGVALGRQFSMDSVDSARLAYFPIALLAVVATFALGLRMRLSTIGALMGALTLVAIPSFSREALSGPRPKLLVVALLVLYLVALHYGRYGVSGALLALATLAWQSSFVLVLVPIALAVWRGPPDKLLRAAVRFLSGGLIFVVLVVGIYAWAGEVGTLIEGFITWNLGLGSSRLPVSLLDAFVDPLKDLWGAHQATWPLLIFGALAILPMSRRIFDVAPSIGQPESPNALDLVTVAFVVLVGWTLVDYQGVVDLFPLLPLAAVGAGRIADHLRFRSSSWSIAIVAIVVVAGGVDLARTRDTTLRQQRADLEVLVGSGCVVSYGDPVALAITGQSNPSRFFFMVPGLDEYLGSGAEDYIGTLIARRPDFVAGPTNLEDGNLGRAVDAILPSAGYEPASTERYVGWISPSTEASQRSNCTFSQD